MVDQTGDVCPSCNNLTRFLLRDRDVAPQVVKALVECNVLDYHDSYGFVQG